MTGRRGALGFTRSAVFTAATALAGLLTVAAPASAATAGSGSAGSIGYDLPEAGVYLEGIGVDQRAGYVYVISNIGAFGPVSYTHLTLPTSDLV